MALNYETLIRAASKSPEQRTTTEVNDVIFPWLKQSLKKKQGIFQKISDDVIQDICRTVTLERRPPWDVVIRQNDPGDTFYIILQGAVNIYRLDDDTTHPIEYNFDPKSKFPEFDDDPDQREALINHTFGNYVVTLVGGFDFGERALVTDEPRSATVMTTNPTDLLVIDRVVFNRTLKSAHEKELQEKTEFINRCPFFSSWSARLKRLVSLSLERGRFSYDSVLYKQGAPADAVYFIWNGEVKLSMDPLFHWLQYPHLLPASNPMKQRALDFFLPILQTTHPTNGRTMETFVIKRRHMTFAEAEEERARRTNHLALLNQGDMIGLESYVCDLTTHMNSARCTAPCDLFYILKHNFVRLQKRHGTQGLHERLRETVLLSFQAYPTRVLQLPLIETIMKRYLLPISDDDQHQHYHNKHSWLLHVTSTHSGNNGTNARRFDGKRIQSSKTNSSTSSRATRYQAFGNMAKKMQYVRKDHMHVNHLENRLKQWHSEMGDDSKTQIRSLTRYSMERHTRSALGRTTLKDTMEARSDSTGYASSLSSHDDASSTPPLLIEIVDSNTESVTTSPLISMFTQPNTEPIPKMRIYTKQEQYEDLRAYLKQAWKEFLKRPIPTAY